ncbi:MAG: XdhC/CoxI family protein [Candidatus Eisenbacteria bacterium]|nr:XdhC/CoxI family protein [Candidatus Eisenbacteria bacterium]
MDIFEEAAEKRGEGHTFVLATMVRGEGSSPRDVGAKMLVFPDGSISGTIGGGNFEKMVVDDCLSLFGGSVSPTGPRTLLKTYRFSRSGPDATGMCCGGEADVFMELLAPPERLLIFGGGHIARALVGIAASLDFRITIVDDRPEILDQYRKPVETILTDPEYEESFPRLDENCFVVIVTRSHVVDRRVLAKVIRENVAYLGMIGSKTKIAETVAFLKAYGIEESFSGKVHTPIGLDIGAEGPHEIAVSIAAELIAVRRKGAGSC